MEEFMWILLNQLNQQHLQYFNSIGRALVLAQHFEVICQSVLSWWVIAERAGKIDPRNVDEFRKILDKGFKAPLLGESLKILDKDFGISKEDLELLQKAKEARNFIAHESTLAIQFSPKSHENLEIAIHKLKKEIKVLSEADNLISSWDYMFHEKDDQVPYTLYTTYSQTLTDWILEPLASYIAESQS